MRQKPVYTTLDNDWKWIRGYKGLYAVCTDGEVWSSRRWRLLKRVPNPRYLTVCLSKNNIKNHCLVHMLVANAFIGKCPKGKQVNHKDLNKINCHVSNLEYVTSGDNTRHARKNKYWSNGFKEAKAQVIFDRMREGI